MACNFGRAQRRSVDAKWKLGHELVGYAVALLLQICILLLSPIPQLGQLGQFM